MIAPSIWLVRWSGLTIAPHSKAVTIRTSFTASPAPAATSAQVAT